jgi:SET domain-containing protein
MSLIVKSGIHGRGVFTTAPVAKGSLLLTYGGPQLRFLETTPQTLAVQIDLDLYLGASGGMDDYVNHSCDPNAGLVISSRDDVRLIAIRDIAAGEEIFFDYSTTMNEDDFEMPCHCGRPGCRGIIRDFKHLPVELKRRYIALGIVPMYNRGFVD